MEREYIFVFVGLWVFVHMRESGCLHIYVCLNCVAVEKEVCVLSSAWCVLQWRRRCVFVCVCVWCSVLCVRVEKDVCVVSSVWCVVQWRRRCVCVCVCVLSSVWCVIQWRRGCVCVFGGVCLLCGCGGGV